MKSVQEAKEFIKRQWVAVQDLFPGQRIIDISPHNNSLNFMEREDWWAIVTFEGGRLEDRKLVNEWIGKVMVF